MGLLKRLNFIMYSLDNQLMKMRQGQKDFVGRKRHTFCYAEPFSLVSSNSICLQAWVYTGFLGFWKPVEFSDNCFYPFKNVR